MAVRIRLMRMGKNKQPTYRLVAADARSPRNGRALEVLGHYDPRKEPSEIVVKRERVLWWLNNGAQCSESAEKLLRIEGTLEEFEEQKRAAKASKEAQ